MLSAFLTPTTESDHTAGNVVREGEMQVLLSLQLVALLAVGSAHMILGAGKQSAHGRSLQSGEGR